MDGEYARMPAPVDLAGSEPLLLPSRHAALAAARADLARGPVLITGGAGSGKTWLATRLVAGCDPALRWACVDLGPAVEPRGLLRAVAAELGLDGRRADRPALRAALAESAADGHRWGLLLDEAHLAPTETLEEVRLLSNDLGRAAGFAALVILGQTPLLRRLELRSLNALAVRLTGRVHLRSLDADEAHALLRRRVDPDIDADRADELHRATGGNPRLLLHQGAAIGRPAPVAVTAPAPSPARSREGLVVPPEMVRLGTPRPPLVEADGVVEVGWENDETPYETDAEPTLAPVDEPEAGPVGVEDHYAALQAWDEWTRNQGRVESEPARASARVAAAASPGDAPGQLRFEHEQAFAPYGQLFSRLRTSQDPEA